jgi:hypothetical protein
MSPDIGRIDLDWNNVEFHARLRAAEVNAAKHALGARGVLEAGQQNGPIAPKTRAHAEIMDLNGGCLCHPSS